MKFDWHTHTVYSHGRGSIEDNIREARKKGLESVAITDHGPGHFGYGFRRRDVPRMRAEIDSLREKYSDIKIYMSVEANIINRSGNLDVRPEEFGDYDFVIAGYHFGTLGESKPGSLALHGRNLLASKLGRYSDRLVELNTELAVNAIICNKITTLTHPGDKGSVIMEEVYKACEKTGTLLEISNRHRQLTVDELRLARGRDLKFIIGSDAHVPERVGTFEHAVERALESGIELERIVNLKIQ